MSRSKDRAGERQGSGTNHPGIIFRNQPDAKRFSVGKVFFDTWEYRERVTIDGLVTYRPVDDQVNRIMPVNSGNWEQVVLKGAELTSNRVVSISREAGQSVAAFSAMGKSDRVGAFFRSSFGFAQRMYSAKNSAQMTEVLKERGSYLRKAGADIRRTQDWGYVAEIARELKAAEQIDLAGRSAFLVGVDLRALHLLAGRQNRFLAGVDQQRPFWKDVELPPVYDITGLPIVHITNPFVSFLDDVRSDQLAAMPGKLIEPKNYKKIKIPEQEETIAGILKDVLKTQAYTMTREGFAANLADCDDVTKMVVVEGAKGVVFFRGETKYGDLSAIIFKNQADGYFSDMLPEIVVGQTALDDMAKRTRLGVLAARVYRDYLCPEEITLTGQRPEHKPRQSAGEKKDPKHRNVRRVIVHDERIGPLPDKEPFTGQRVPDFIQVSGYIRSREGGASPETLRKAKEWEAQSPFDLPPFDLKTEEPIPPYTKPPGMQKWYYRIPEFWREELREEAFKPNKGFTRRPSRITQEPGVGS